MFLFLDVLDVPNEVAGASPGIPDLKCKEKLSEMALLDKEEMGGCMGIQNFAHLAPKSAHRPTPLKLPPVFTGSHSLQPAFML